MDYVEKIVWHEVTTRPPTEEENERYKRAIGNGLDVVYDCLMPEDYDEILVYYGKGRVYVDTCLETEHGLGLEIRGDWGDVLAWAEMPKGESGKDDG